MARNWTESDIGDQEQPGHPVEVRRSRRARAAAVARRFWDVSVELAGADHGRLA